MAKLMGFDFDIQHKEGKLIVASDTLSRRSNFELLMLLLSNIATDFDGLIKDFWSLDSSLVKIIGKLKSQTGSHPKFTWNNEELQWNGKLVIGNDPSLKSHILHWLHNSLIGGILVEMPLLLESNPFFIGKG